MHHIILTKNQTQFVYNSKRRYTCTVVMYFYWY